MEKGSYVAISGAMAQERAMEVISNNLANVNTPGFKGDRLLFESYLQKSMGQKPAIPTPDQIMKGTLGQQTEDSEYLVNSEGYTDHTQGSLQHTSNSMDFAISGDGFFAVMTPDGEKYTRGGTFSIGRNGELTTADGHQLLNTNNEPIYLNDRSFYAADDGTLVDFDHEPIGQLKVVSFENMAQLKKEGGSLYSAQDTQTASYSNALIKQGYIESSNINAVAEMTKMITAQRSYQTFQKAIQSQDDMTSRLINDVGRP